MPEYRPSKTGSFSPAADEEWETGLLNSGRPEQKLQPPKHILKPALHTLDTPMSTIRKSSDPEASILTVHDQDQLRSLKQKRYLEEYQEYSDLVSDYKKVTFWDFLVACVLPCDSIKSNLHSLMKKSTISTYSNFDILKIAQAVDEVEKLKYFLFTPAQLSLYNLLPRQHVAYLQTLKEPPVSFIGQPSHSDDISGKYENLFKAFHTIKSSESHSELDLKLLLAFDSLLSNTASLGDSRIYPAP